MQSPLMMISAGSSWGGILRRRRARIGAAQIWSGHQPTAVCRGKRSVPMNGNMTRGRSPSAGCVEAGLVPRALDQHADL